MKTIFIKDYIYSFKRGNFLDSIKLFLNYITKLCIFNILAFLFLFKFIRKFEESKVNQVAIYIPETSGLGDLIMSNLFFKNLRKKFPVANIKVFTKNGLFINKLYYDELIDISHIGLFKQISAINNYQFDLLLLPEKSIKSSMLFLLSNVKFKLGYLSSYRLSGNFKSIKYRFIPHKDHYYLKSYNLFKVLHNDQVSANVSYAPDLSYLNKLPVNPNKDYILFIPCVQWGNRTISFEYAKLIAEEVLNSKYILFLGGGLESIQTNKLLIKEFEMYKDKVLFQENLKLLEFTDVVRNSKAVICGDSGPMHIAYGFKKPVLSFWGPTFPDLRIPQKSDGKSIVIFEKQNCKVSNCYNMEHKPFCKTCLRLENIPDLSQKIKHFILALS